MDFLEKAFLAFCGAVMGTAITVTVVTVVQLGGKPSNADVDPANWPVASWSN